MLIESIVRSCRIMFTLNHVLLGNHAAIAIPFSQNNI
jgi:hypothetical protein